MMVQNFLMVTRNLVQKEITAWNPALALAPSKFQVNVAISCLSGLRFFYSTLRHLLVDNLFPARAGLEGWQPPNFLVLERLAMDHISFLSRLARNDSFKSLKEVRLLSSRAVDVSGRSIEYHLADSIKRRDLYPQSFNKVVGIKSPIAEMGAKVDLEESQLRRWKGNVERLEVTCEERNIKLELLGFGDASEFRKSQSRKSKAKQARRPEFRSLRSFP